MQEGIVLDYKQEYTKWLQWELVESSLKEELKTLTDEKEIEDRFYKNLEFGTGGLRGKIGAGSNRMNVHTVAKVTMGLANYLCKNVEGAKVAIAYDSRNKSDEFAKMAASVLCASGVKVYLYESLRPVPMLSFAVRHLGADAGIVITASHNPKEYNGYKVYGNDGGQVTDSMANSMLEEMNAIDMYEGIKTITLEEAAQKGLLVMIGEEVDEAYYERVEGLAIQKQLLKEKGANLSILYTPIHGSGNIPVRTILKRLGFSNVEVIKEQELPDGNFPTAPYPNPEDRKVFELAIERANVTEPDLIFGTDPDCDRIGVVVKTDEGYKVLTGNQVGVLLTDYMLRARAQMGLSTPKDTIIKTIVTTEMAAAVAKNYGANLLNVLTGFKYIGEKIKEFLQTGEKTFVLGFEESYGYLAGDFVRDKDGVIAAALIAEMSLYYKEQGKTLYEALENLYQTYGYYKEDLVSLEMQGKDGQEKIAQILANLRANPIKEVMGIKVKSIEDYKSSKAYDLLQDIEEDIHLPTSNVLKFILEDGKWFVVRPSGTEPKMKIYVSAIGQTNEEALVLLQQFKEAVLKAVK